jgi:hypothetical protein
LGQAWIAVALGAIENAESQLGGVEIAARAVPAQAYPLAYPA